MSISNFSNYHSKKSYRVPLESELFRDDLTYIKYDKLTKISKDSNQLEQYMITEGVYDETKLIRPVITTPMDNIKFDHSEALEKMKQTALTNIELNNHQIKTITFT